MPEVTSPSKKLIAALEQYSEELEAIKMSLESAMTLFSVIREEKHKELKVFAETHGSDVSEQDGTLRFSISADKITDYRRLNYHITSLQSSQRLMPRNLLVALVCTYDAFLGKLLRFILEVKPGILDSSDKQLSFSELQQYTSIDAAREFIVEKEIEGVLRKSHIDHFKWLENTLGTPFNKGLESWPEFVELTERRNLFVHTDGLVSSQYLKICKEHKCRLKEDVAVGVRLGVPKSYFDASYYTLYEIGIKLAHVIWRKLLKEELESIDDNLCAFTFSLIEKRDYPIAIRVLEFFTQSNMAHHEEASRRVMLINLAQAYKWNKQLDKCNALLDAHDWSALHHKFRLAVVVLREKWDEAFALMRRLKDDPEFKKAAYKDWPLFKQLRKAEGFSAVYEECYGESFGSREEIMAHESHGEDSERGDVLNEKSVNALGDLLPDCE